MVTRYCFLLFDDNTLRVIDRATDTILATFSRDELEHVVQHVDALNEREPMLDKYPVK